MVLSLFYPVIFEHRVILVSYYRYIVRASAECECDVTTSGAEARRCDAWTTVTRWWAGRRDLRFEAGTAIEKIAMSTSSLFYKDKYAVSAYDARTHTYIYCFSVAVRPWPFLIITARIG